MNYISDSEKKNNIILKKGRGKYKDQRNNDIFKNKQI